MTLNCFAINYVCLRTVLFLAMTCVKPFVALLLIFNFAIWDAFYNCHMFIFMNKLFYCYWKKNGREMVRTIFLLEIN